MGTTRFVWDVVSDAYLCEASDSARITYTNEPLMYGRMISQHTSDMTYIFHMDGQLSTRQITQADGSVSDEYVYSAFGDMVAHIGRSDNRFRFHGEVGLYYDVELGYIYARRRYLSTNVGRFISTDPFRSLSSNGFTYALNAPVMRSDPSGLKADVWSWLCGASHTDDFMDRMQLLSELGYADRDDSKYWKGGKVGELQARAGVVGQVCGQDLEFIVEVSASVTVGLSLRTSRLKAIIGAGETDCTFQATSSLEKSLHGVFKCPIPCSDGQCHMQLLSAIIWSQTDNGNVWENLTRPGQLLALRARFIPQSCFCKLIDCKIDVFICQTEFGFEYDKLDKVFDGGVAKYFGPSVAGISKPPAILGSEPLPTKGDIPTALGNCVATPTRPYPS